MNLHDMQNRLFALSIIDTMQMWTAPAYSEPLKNGLTTLEAEWFRQFTVKWRVARTIVQKSRDDVRAYLDTDFRKRLYAGSGPETVDVAAKFIQSRGWSSHTGRSNKPSLPISLVSKIGFFLQPSQLVPLDQYSLAGLNRAGKQSGEFVLRSPSYAEYYAAFCKQFQIMQPKITTLIAESWVGSLGERLGCQIDTLSPVAFQRKVFDNYLMLIGGYAA